MHPVNEPAGFFPEPADPVAPVHWHRGRGAVSRPQGRFETDARAPFEDGWPGDPGNTDAPGVPRTTVTPERARSLITSNRSPDVPFDQSVNPYRGCEHGCIYCFARPTHSYLGLSPGIDFETRLFARVNAREVLERELSAPAYRCSPLAIGTATDAWQPVEREWQLTRQILQVLHDSHHPCSFVTKSALVERDLDLLAPMARRGLVHAWVTLTTLDAELARLWEPRAAAPWRRLETIRRLAEAGIPVGVSISPLAPFLNEPELEAIVEAAAQAGARHGFFMVLRLPWELQDVFQDWLRTHFPDRASRVLARLSEMRSADGTSRLNDPRFHHRMKGEGVWADLLGLRFDRIRRKCGLDPRPEALRTDLFRAPSRVGQLGLF